jgi:hypothetical protein
MCLLDEIIIVIVYFLLFDRYLFFSKVIFVNFFIAIFYIKKKKISYLQKMLYENLNLNIEMSRK